MRQNYEMTEADLHELLEAMKLAPMIMLQCGTPRSVQENANVAWAALGLKMNFDPMTVRPNDKGDRFFSAESIPRESIETEPTDCVLHGKVGFDGDCPRC